MNEPDIRALRTRILCWYDGRARELPWRGASDPYRIWVSEIMLQQTRAETVIPYYHAFMRDYPDVRALADADLTDVLKHWEGLGYYSRARSLHRAAGMVARELGGIFPRDAEGLRLLPGVGEYTAGMIASVAYGLLEPAVDGNQARVLSRVFEMDEPARAPAGVKRLRALARALLDPERPGDFNQALMDIGAGICKPRRAECAECPAQRHCLARASGHPERLPMLPARAQKRVERRGVAVATCGGKALVQRRPEAGLLGGLWVFPNFLDAASPRALTECLLEMGVSAKPGDKLPDVEHVFTHLVWKQSGRAFAAEECVEIEGARWVDAAGLRALPMPAAMRTYREAALALLEDSTNPNP